MSIVGKHPESGVRIVLERPRDGGPPWVYAGAAFTPTEEHTLRATVAEDGGVRVELPAGGPSELAMRVELMIRAAYKHALADDAKAGPPRHLQRWRAASGGMRK